MSELKYQLMLNKFIADLEESHKKEVAQVCAVAIRMMYRLDVNG